MYWLRGSITSDATRLISFRETRSIRSGSSSTGMNRLLSLGVHFFLKYRDDLIPDQFIYDG